MLKAWERVSRRLGEKLRILQTIVWRYTQQRLITTTDEGLLACPAVPHARQKQELNHVIAADASIWFVTTHWPRCRFSISRTVTLLGEPAVAPRSSAPFFLHAAGFRFRRR